MIKLTWPQTGERSGVQSTKNGLKQTLDDRKMTAMVQRTHEEGQGVVHAGDDETDTKAAGERSKKRCQRSLISLVHFRL